MSADGTVHRDGHDHYLVPANASPRQKLGYALRFLESGQVTTARRLLAEVVEHIDDEPNVWFHWLLAFFSGRTEWELSDEDRESLDTARERMRAIAGDSCWSRGIGVVDRLVEAGDPAGLDDLDEGMRAAILRHLDRVLRGPVKDRIWPRSVEQARADRTADRRADRVGKFFEPDPAGPRAGPLRPPEVDAGQLTLAMLTSLIVVGAGCLLGWLAFRRGDSTALIAIMIGLAAAFVALANGAECRFRDERRRAEERERKSWRFPGDDPPAAGFTGEVDRMYRQYIARTVTGEAERIAWMREAYVPMCRWRDELIEAYRGTRVTAAEVRWLIRFQLRELERRWRKGEFSGVPERRSVKVAGVAGVVVAVICMLVAGRQDLGAAVTIILAGWAATGPVLRIAAENKRVAVEAEDRRERWNAAWFEYQRCRHHLDDRPSDGEMARWLDCDRRLLLCQALEACGLGWSDVSAYACMEARAGRGSRARVVNGPWRYSRYRLMVFLLTADGIRQVTAELDVAGASFEDWRLTGYGYDEVVAARVARRGDGTRELRLILRDSTEVELGLIEAGWAGVVDDGALDVTGLRSTLFVLEGAAGVLNQDAGMLNQDAGVLDQERGRPAAQTRSNSPAKCRNQ